MADIYQNVQMNTLRKRALDGAITASLAANIIILPVAHIPAVRASFQILALLLMGAKMYQNRAWMARRTPLDLPLFIFLVTIVISFFTTLSLETSIKAFKGEFINCAVFFYMVASATDDEDISILVKALLAGSFVLAAYGIIDFFSHSSGLFTMGYRAGSLHQGYEAYGQYIIMVLPFNILGFLYMKGRQERFFLAIVLLLNCVALFLTYTRGAWVAFCVELFSAALLVPKTRVFKAALAGSLLIGPLLVLSILPGNLVWHGSSGVNADIRSPRNTVETRLRMWKGFFREFSKNPFEPAGYGKTNFKRKYKGDDFTDAVGDKGVEFEQAHNTFINTAAQLGIQGLIALLFIIYTVLKISLKAWKRGLSDFDRAFGLSMFIMTIGFFTANQFAEFYIDDTSLMFWIFVGMLVSVYNNIKMDDRMRVESRRCGS